jgi:Glyoxalase-like domain
MSTLRFDHFITYTAASSIDAYMAEYAAQGFIIHDETVRHSPGLRNGFVIFGPEYLEFCWVEDSAAFATADAEEHAFRAAQRPYGIGIFNRDVQALHNEWVARGYDVPPITSRAADAAPDAPLAWSFLTIPRQLLPGCHCFAFTYHGATANNPWDVRVGPNTIYAIAGPTFVAPDPHAHATCWRNLLAPQAALSESETGSSIQIGSQHAIWVSPAMYQSLTGWPWVAASHACGELALIRLWAHDLAQARHYLEHGGRSVSLRHIVGKDVLLVAADRRDGMALLIQQQPMAVWLQEWATHTEEQLNLID